MNRFRPSPKFLVAATLATAALGAATVAEARPEVFLSIGLQSGPAWVEPARGYVHPQPVYVQPRRVFVEPAPVYLRPPVFVSPRPVFGRYDARVEWQRGHDWRRGGWRDHDRHDRRDGDRGRDHHGDDRHGDDRGNGRGHRD